jgi:hypothetical protein
VQEVIYYFIVVSAFVKYFLRKANKVLDLFMKYARISSLSSNLGLLLRTNSSSGL